VRPKERHKGSTRDFGSSAKGPIRQRQSRMRADWDEKKKSPAQRGKKGRDKQKEKKKDQAISKKQERKVSIRGTNAVRETGSTYTNSKVRKKKSRRSSSDRNTREKQTRGETGREKGRHFGFFSQSKKTKVRNGPKVYKSDKR